MGKKSKDEKKVKKEKKSKKRKLEEIEQEEIMQEEPGAEEEPTEEMMVEVESSESEQAEEPFSESESEQEEPHSSVQNRLIIKVNIIQKPEIKIRRDPFRDYYMAMITAEFGDDIDALRKVYNSLPMCSNCRTNISMKTERYRS
jgi:Ribosome-assembly protein 3